MTDIIYYAEVEISQKGDVNLKVLEDLEELIFEAQEGLPDDEIIIDEEKVVIDDEEGIILLMSEDYDNLEEVKEKTVAFLKKHVDESQFSITLHFYKSEYLDELSI